MFNIPAQHKFYAPAIISVVLSHPSDFWEYRVMLMVEVDGKTEEFNEGSHHSLIPALDELQDMIDYATGAYQ